MATTIWLARHGETKANVDGVFQGQMDSPLNNRGRQQASEVANALASVHFDNIYASDLSRAADTALAIAQFKDMDVTFVPEIRELHYGVLQGVAFARFREVLAEHGVADQWGDGIFSRDGMAPPEGESISDLRSRVAHFVQRVDSEHPPERENSILVVAHGGTLRVMLTVLLGLPIEARQAFAFANCSISRVSRAEDHTRLELHNAIYWQPQESDGHTSRRMPVQGHSERTS